MASANRPRYATPRGGRPRTPRRPGGPTLNVTGPELTGLLSNMASLATQRTSDGGRLPAGATPNKCEMEMTAAGFRTWRCSIETWLRLAGWSNEEAVLHIRLLCAPDLQCAVDARFDRNQWETMQPREALDAISKLVLQTSNQAVRWSDFFNARQTPGE
ncbi:hypothetical protein Pmani_002795 [Petrolisthes manimaculis]|uniref:Uncharacterized protein n=1 Tax=Petrolisthes manimaculis TaxID=1843537 RepID=A0AAE1UJ48_9EUCA|nr:hypothetical protein Pmani_002795 [Petrolisthes manimaculis]